jgi:hypothetical protein
VLYQPSTVLYWEVGSSGAATSCATNGFLYSGSDDCPVSPDGSGCAGKWRQNADYGDCHTSDSIIWCTNPAITVVAVSGGGR